jgi:hypothetical protein
MGLTEEGAFYMPSFGISHLERIQTTPCKGWNNQDRKSMTLQEAFPQQTSGVPAQDKSIWLQVTWYFLMSKGQDPALAALIDKPVFHI